MNFPSPFVSTQYLFDHLNDDDIRILDCSWYLPNANRNCAAEYESAHIPGAVFFDIDSIADLTQDLPHMVANPEKFELMVGALGINDTDTIIVYDSAGLLSAARVWWNFSIMGARKCFVLNGGLPKWLAEQRPTHEGVSVPNLGTFNAQFQPDAAVGVEEMAKTVAEFETSAGIQIVDVRPAPRFGGQEEEPRPGLRRGKMPGSINLPFPELILDGRLLDEEGIRRAFRHARIDITKPIISSCGSGVTAPILNLALAVLGIDAMRVYDGSWAEWGAKVELPVIGLNGERI